MANSAVRNLPSVPSGQSGLYHHEEASVPVIAAGAFWYDAAGRRWEGTAWSTATYDVHPPVITSAVAFSVAENASLTINLTVDKAVTWAKVAGADASAFALAGATATFAAKNFEAPSDVGANNVYNAAFTATDGAGNVTPFEIAVTVTDVFEAVAPVIATVVVNDTTPTVGDTLSAAVTYSVAGDPAPALLRVWKVGGTVAGTSATYAVVSADIGKTIVCEATATNAAGASAVSSAVTAAVEAAPVAPTAPVIATVGISDTTPTVGDVLTAAIAYSTAGNPAPSVTYDWKVDGTTAATTASYTVVSANVGKAITLTATATNAGGSSSKTSAATSLVAGGGGAMVLRGYNPGMTVSANSVRIGGANRTLGCAVTRKLPFTFRRFKVVQQVFSPVNRVDTLYDKSTKFAHAFRAGGRSTFTGIPAREIVAQWGNGAKNFLDFDTATWDANTGWAVSDTIDLGVETDTMDCWQVASAPASITTPSSHFYAMETVADNLIQHGAGTFTSTTDAIADGSWLSVNSLIATPANAAGSNSFMSPAMYLIEVPGTTKCVVLFTDSHGVGLNSGGGATMVDGVEYGGPMGNDKLAMSWLDRGISDLGIGYCRLGQGGDGDRYWGPNPNNWRFRKGLGILANPTHVGDESATNDMGVVGSQSNVDAGKTFVRGAALRHIGAGKVYLCTQAGDINGQMPEGTSADALGTEITSGTAKFTCTGTFTTALFNATAVLGVQMMVSDQIKAQWPSIPFIRCGLLPDAASSNNFADLAGQTPNGAFGQGAASKRGQYLQLQKSALGKALLRYDFAWYPEQFIENDPANYDSLIKPDAAVPNKLMFASHLTSYGHHVARQAVTPQALA